MITKAKQMKHGLFCLICTALVLAQSLPASADFMETFKTRGRSIYLVHAVPVATSKTDTSIIALGKRDRARLTTLGAVAGESPFLPVGDIETMVRRIDALTEEFEASKDGERLQRLRFDIAYEYFLLYLHFQKIKYGIDSEKRHPEESVPVSDDELKQYLMLSRHYISPFLEKAKSADAANPSMGDMDDITFRVRNDPTSYLNVHFLAMMLEGERLAGGWDIDHGFQGINHISETKTWHWLETLWKRSNRKSSGVAYTPTPERLFALYELYLKYHFLGRSLRHDEKTDPLTDMKTRTLLSRLSKLEKASSTVGGTPYAHYVREANMDSGNTSFIVNLYLARRGFSVLASNSLPASKAQLFELFQAYYNRAAKEIRYNIPYRKKIYNELILMGVETGNLRLMEDVLYQYGLMAMRIPGSEKKISYIGDSSRFTMAYLLANILEKKRLSGLSDDSGKYADMAGTLVDTLVSKRTPYWRYASVIHRSLAEYHSGAHAAQSESLAIYHSRRAFLTLCKKLSLNGKAGDWEAFQGMPESESFIGLFLYYQKKYPTSPDASTPREYHAQRIIEMKMKQNRS